MEIIFLVHDQFPGIYIHCMLLIGCVCTNTQTNTCIYTSIKIIKNEVGCRDDTVPKTVDTRRHCEEE